MPDALSDRAKIASTALGHLQRTVRFFRLYPHEHKFCVLGLDETFAALTEFHRAHGPLAVEVGNDGLFLDEEQVLAEGESRNDLVGLFYFEGIRELTLDLGMPKEELGTLVEILAAPYREGGHKDVFADDLTTALWREDLRYVAYQTHDPLAADVVRRNRDEEGVMAALMARIRGLVESLGGSLEARDEKPPAEPGAETLDADAFLTQLSEQEAALDDKSDWATRPDRVLEYLDTDKGRERRRLVDELSRMGGEDMTRAAEVVAWSVSARHPAVRDEDAARFLSGSALHALSEGDLEQAARMASFASHASQGEDSRLASLVAARLGSQEGIEAFSKTLTLKAAQLPGKKLAEIGRDYLSSLGRTAVAGTCASYAAVEDVRVRRVFRDFLATHLEAEAESIAQVSQHSNATISGELIALLSSQGQGSAAFRALQRLAERFQPASEKVLEMTGEGERRRRVQTVRGDASRNDRMLAVAGLARNPARSTFNDLSPLLHDESLHGRDEQEILAIMDLLIACDRAGARTALGKLEERKVPLLRGRGDTLRLKQCAVDRLDRLKGAP